MHGCVHTRAIAQGFASERSPEGTLLARFTYDALGGPSTQTFAAAPPGPAHDGVASNGGDGEDVGGGVFPIVQLRVLSNNGGANYTCLYRFRVHGHPL